MTQELFSLSSNGGSNGFNADGRIVVDRLEDRLYGLAIYLGIRSKEWVKLDLSLDIGGQLLINPQSGPRNRPIFLT